MWSGRLEDSTLQQLLLWCEGTSGMPKAGTKASQAYGKVCMVNRIMLQQHHVANGHLKDSTLQQLLLWCEGTSGMLDDETMLCHKTLT